MFSSAFTFVYSLHVYLSLCTHTCTHTNGQMYIYNMDTHICLQRHVQEYVSSDLWALDVHYSHALWAKLPCRRYLCLSEIPSNSKALKVVLREDTNDHKQEIPLVVRVYQNFLKHSSTSHKAMIIHDSRALGEAAPGRATGAVSDTPGMRCEHIVSICCVVSPGQP